MNAYDKAVSLLAIREHTANEIYKKLLDKGYRKEEAEEAISLLLSRGYISEERFAESFIRSRLKKNPEGKAILRMRLKEKGTPSEVIENALNDTWENELYLEPLKREYEDLCKKKGAEKAIQKLYQKGFSISEIKKAASLSSYDSD